MSGFSEEQLSAIHDPSKICERVEFWAPVAYIVGAAFTAISLWFTLPYVGVGDVAATILGCSVLVFTFLVHELAERHSQLYFAGAAAWPCVGVGALLVTLALWVVCDVLAAAPACMGTVGSVAWPVVRLGLCCAVFWGLGRGYLYVLGLGFSRLMDYVKRRGVVMTANDHTDHNTAGWMHAALRLLNGNFLASVD